MTDTGDREAYGQSRGTTPTRKPAINEQTTLRRLADNVPSQYSYVDADEVYCYVNRVYEQRFNTPADRIVGRTVREVLGPDNYSIAEPYIRAVLAGSPQRYEQLFRFPEGPRSMEVTYSPDRLEDGSIRGFFVLVHDITERKALEDRLRGSQAHLAAIINTAADGIITVDSRGTVRDFNPAAERMFGRPADTVIGREARLFLPPYCQTCNEYPSCFRTGRCPHNRVHPQELLGTRADGGRFPMEITVSQIDEQHLYVVQLRDISERRQLEREIINAATLEQARIGREIHDGIGQQLTAISLLAGGIERRLDAAGHAQEAAAVGELVEHLQLALNQVHLLAQGLAPVEIDPEGLGEALSQLTRDVQRTSGITCSYQGTDHPQVENSEIALHLYRIAQEAVNNAVKHGQPGHIYIRLVRTEGNLELAVQDDGGGITGIAERSGRLGLYLMRYRASILGGQLQIGPAEAAGTLVRCLIPLQD